MWRIDKSKDPPNDGCYRNGDACPETHAQPKRGNGAALLANRSPDWKCRFERARLRPFAPNVFLDAGGGSTISFAHKGTAAGKPTSLIWNGAAAVITAA
jgi:hypothetical protein